VNSPKGILGGGSDQSSGRDGVPFFLKLGDGESVLQRSTGSSKTTSSFPLVSSSSSLASIAARGGENWCTTGAAKAKAVTQLGSKIRMIYGTIYRGFWIGSSMTKILTLFLFESNSISQRFGRNQEAGECGSVTITETEFSTGLARAKAKTLSGSSRVSRVRLGHGSGS
jgi:hypothetical protein